MQHLDFPLYPDIRLKVKASLQNDETHCSSGNLVVKRSRKYQFGVVSDLLKYLCVFLLIFILHNCLRFQLRTVTDFDTDHTGSDYLIKSAYHDFPYRITPP